MCRSLPVRELSGHLICVGLARVDRCNLARSGERYLGDEQTFDGFFVIVNREDFEQ